MLRLTGAVSGIRMLQLVPVGVRRLTREAPDPSLMAVGCVPDGNGEISVDLVSTAEVAGAWENGWCWRCTEVSNDWQRVTFVLRPVDGTLRYADVRPARRGR